MERFTCPYTGRVFTNPKIFRQHVKEWPNVCKQNGLNLDGLSKVEQVETTEPIAEEVVEPVIECELPEDIPHRVTLDNAGVRSLKDLPTDLRGLVKLPNIGKQKASEIIEWLALNG